MRDVFKTTNEVFLSLSRDKLVRTLIRLLQDIHVAMDVNDALCLGHLIRQRNGFLPDDQLYRMRSQDVQEQC